MRRSGRALAAFSESFASFWGVMLLGVVIRFLLSFWTGHPWDFEVWVRLGYHVAHGLNPYSFLQPVPGLSFSGYGTMTSLGYPPFWALVSGAAYGVFSLASTSKYLYYFLLKLPSIAGDVTLGYLLYLFIRRQGKTDDAKSVLKFWMICPYTVVISAVWGIFDALTMCFVIACLLLLNSNAGKSAFSIGLGIFLKLLPAIYLPVVASSLRNGRKRILFIAVALVVPVAFSLLPFLAFGWDISGLLNSTASQGMKIAGGAFLSFGELIQYLYPNQIKIPEAFVIGSSLVWVPVMLLTYYLIWKRREGGRNPKQTIGVLLIVTYVFFISRMIFNEQYLIYPLALTLIDVTLWHPGRKKLFTIIWLTSLAYLVASNTLLIRFTSPAVASAWNLDIEINNTPPTATIRYVVRSVLGVAMLITMLEYLVKVVREVSSKKFLGSGTEKT